jgi:hypothetical protein
VTKPFFPPVKEGTMIVFPSEYLHFVAPYSGRRRRITLSWNVNDHPVKGSALDPADQKEI